jgi:hypothetical protein
MYVKTERGSESENFCATNTEFGVVVRKISTFEVLGLFCEFFWG